MALAGYARDCAMIPAMYRSLPILLALLLVACASQPLPGRVYEAPRDAFSQLIVESPWPTAPDEDVLALPEDAKPFIARAIAGRGGTISRVQRLAQLFGGNGALGMDYEVLAVGTAKETFESRVGSCLSYTHLYIAMARSIGIDARYREILAVPQWEVIGEFAVLNRHVAAYGEVPLVGSYVMDFGLLAENERQFGRVISDRRARAQHFNNRGALALSNGESELAVGYFNRALLLDPTLSFIWANLGTAYMRLGDYPRAEQSLRQSLAIRSYETTAMNQLARLYQLIGRDDLVAHYKARAENARNQNPYLLYQRAVSAREAGDHTEAIGLLRRAVRVQKDEMNFFVELGRTYRAIGDVRRARRAFLEANELAETLEDRATLLEALGEPATMPTELVVPALDGATDAPETDPAPR